MHHPVVLDANQPPARFYRGGAQIRELRGDAAPGDRVPEDWVASSTTVRGETAIGLTVLPDGRALREAQRADPVAWFGPDHAATRGADPYLLVKLLDAGERLPVHAHPDDAFAARHLGEPHGKAEAWIVLVGGRIRLGFRRDVSREELAGWVERQDRAAMLDAMHEVELEPGEGVLVPPGMPHAIGEGMLILEVQQPSDLSILLEWEGYEIDGAAVGHLGAGWEIALDAVDVRGRDRDELEKLITRAAAPELLPPEAARWFRVAQHDGGDRDVLPAAFRVLVAVEGAGRIEPAGAAGWPPVELARGATVVVPHAAGPLRLAGDVRVVECSPPPGVGWMSS